MRIIQVINSLSSGGAENFVAQLSIELSKTNEIYLIIYAGVLDKKGNFLYSELINNSVKVISLSSTTLLSKLLIPIKLSIIIKRIKPDLIHSHLEQSDIFLTLSRLFIGNLNIKYVRTIHNSLAWTRVPVFVNKALFKFFKLNIACSESVTKDYSITSCRNKLSFVDNGINLDFVNSIKDTKLFYRTKYNVPLDYTVFLSVGKFRNMENKLVKGQDLLIEAFKLVKIPKLLLIFVGDGLYLESMKDFAVQLGLDNVVFTGQVNSVNEYLALADFIVMPSHAEGLPIAAIEAVCLGKPLISSRISAFKVFESSSHIYMSKITPKDIAEAIEKAISEKDQLLLSGIENSIFFKSKFNIATCATNYMAEYRKVI